MAAHTSAGDVPPFDAGTFVGLLADDDRRSVFAAIALGADSDAKIRATAVLDARRAATALFKLLESGVVQRSPDGSYTVDAASLRHLAKHSAQSTRADHEEHPDTPSDVAKVLKAFVRDRRLVAIPMARAKRRIVLDLLASDFEPGHHYTEARVNLILGMWHADTAALRRYLVDEGFLDRLPHGIYWRSGGTVRPTEADTPPPTSASE